MADWRDHILREFTSELSRLTLVADPDGLLTEEVVQQGIRKKGFELIPFEDPFAFRYAYESKYRSLWDHGLKSELVVVLRADSNSLSCLPFDLIASGRTLAFGLPTIFPHLSYPVVQLLNSADLDTLYSAYSFHAGKTLGDRATKDFILDHVFDFYPKPTWHAKDLLRGLLRRHYRQQEIAASFDARIIELLRKNPVFDKWPLTEIVRDRPAFLAFLQNAWPKFLQAFRARQLGQTLIPELSADAALDLPFDSEDIRTYVENYFVEGLLAPMSPLGFETDVPDWTRIGIDADRQKLLEKRFLKLRNLLAARLPEIDARYQDWQVFATRWAELNFLRDQRRNRAAGDDDSEFLAFRQKMNASFSAWLLSKYVGLVDQPPSPPVMVHHVLRHIARTAEVWQQPVALIVIDGLALNQWVLMRETLAQSFENFSIHESAVFAWIPTLTPVSRQAIFAGKSPFYFPASINTTVKDEMHWKAFWEDAGLPEQQTHFIKITSKDEAMAIDLLPIGASRALGIVLTTLDQLLHGTVLGMAQLNESIRLWTKNGPLMQIIRQLLQREFYVAIVSDHGNVEATGIGSPREGMLAEVRGQRVRIYPDEVLRQKVAKDWPESVSWPTFGLPQKFYPLIAPSYQAFVSRDKRRVCHGGISIEEVIVPFVEFSPIHLSHANRI